MKAGVQRLENREMGGGRWMSSSSAAIINRPSSATAHHPKLNNSLPRPSSISSRRNELPMAQKRKQSKPPRLISISTAEGKWPGNWESEYLFSFRDLQLLHDDVREDTIVSIFLSVEKHAGLGMSLEGKITTSFTTKCCNCCSPYLRQIKASFKVWILPSTRTTRDSSNPLPLIGGDDPSVIYVKPGYEADLDSLIQDTVRLATSVNETCSETCEKAEPKLLYLGAKNVASVDQRWHKLLELKKRHEFT